MTKSWKWIKRVLWFFLGLLVLLFLAVSILVYMVNSESYLEDYLTDTLGIEAHIGELDVSLLSGTVSISSSRLGPKDDPFLSFESLQGELDYSQLWSSRLTVELLELNNAKARYPFDFKLKSSKKAASEETNLPFDYIDVAAIDINNLDFVYSDGFSLEAKGTDIQVRNLPVADSGFLLFEDLDRLVKASQTTIDAKVSALTSDKSQLNDLELHAYIENKQLIIDSLESGQSSLSLNLLDYSEPDGSLAKSSEKDHSSTVTGNSNEPLDLPFNDIIVKTINLGRTDLEIKDRDSIIVNAIEAHFSQLLLVKDKQALWLDWPTFYQVQDSEFTLSSKALKSEVFDFESMDLAGELKGGQFTLPTFVIEKPLVTLNVDATAQTEADSSSKPDSTPLNIHLPFKGVTLVKGSVSQGELDITQGKKNHVIDNVSLEVSNLPLIRDHTLIYDENQLNVGSNDVQISLTSASYKGQYGEVKDVTADIVLNESEARIKNLNIAKPNVRFAQNSSGRDSTEAGSSSDSSLSDRSSLPLKHIFLEQIDVTEAEFDIELNREQYAGEGINVTLKTLPIYKDNKWLVAEPSAWKDQVDLNIGAQSISVPQGSLANLSVKSSISEGSATVSALSVASADLTINVQADDNKQPQGVLLPIDSLQLQNIDMNEVDLVYKNEDIEYRLLDANLKLDRFPLIRKGSLVSDPMEYMQAASNSLALSAVEVETPEGIVRGLSLQGAVSNKDLMLDYLRTESADIHLKQAAGEQAEVSSEETVEKVNDEKVGQPAQEFSLRTVKIGDLKLENINVNVETVAEDSGGSASESASEALAIKNLYLGATGLILAKNHQTIDQWYGSQLENAFTLVALKVDHIQQAENTIRDLAVTAVQSGQKIEIQPMRLTYNQAPLRAKWIIDLSTQPYQSTYLSQFKGLSLEKLTKSANDESSRVSGLLDGKVDIRFQGLDVDTIASSLSGAIAINNQGPITLHRLNVNKVLRSFLDSQNFGLLDLGGFLLAGPLGLLASQGVSLQDTLSHLGADEGDTQFTHLNVDVNIDKGVVTTKDVAAATLQYRFAFNGVIDLGKQQFKDFKFDIINEKGCSEYGQTLNGNLLSPDIETFTAAFDAVTGSIVGLFKQGVGLITGGACSAVYQGVVPHPEEGAEIIQKEQQRTIDPDAPEEDSEQKSTDSD